MSLTKGKVINRKAVRFRKFLIITAVSLAGALIVGLGSWVVMLNHAPLFTSPLPFTKFLSPKDEDIQRKIEEILSQKDIPFASVTEASDASYLVTLEKGEHVVLSPSKDIDKQISSLQVILFRLTMEGKRLSKLDLRFQNPIIISNDL